MQLTNILTILAAAATTTLAAPAPELESRDINLMAAGTTWTIQNFKRVCTTAKCTFTYGINTNDGSAVTKCNYQATGNPAAHATYSNVKCGAFTIGSSWSDQFGDDKAYTVLSVVKSGQIIYPSYTDAQLAANKAVKPNQSYTPANLPS